MLDDRIREEGINHTQWTRIGLMFTPPHQRRPASATTPITLVMDELRRGRRLVIALDITSRQSRDLGMRLCGFADRFDAEGGDVAP